MKELKGFRKSNEYPFDLISKKVSNLKMFIEIINKHPKDLEKSYKNVVIKNQIEPAIQLYDYILLEIRNFYYAAYLRFGGDVKYPLSAEKTGVVKIFRDNVVAHILAEDPQSIVEFYEKANEYGFQKIYAEWVDFRDSLFAKINDK